MFSTGKYTREKGFKDSELGVYIYILKIQLFLWGKINLQKGKEKNRNKKGRK